MLRREATRTTLSDDDISDMIKTLETSKFKERIKASRLQSQEREHNDTDGKNNSNIFGVKSINASSDNPFEHQSRHFISGFPNDDKYIGTDAGNFPIHKSQRTYPNSYDSHGNLGNMDVTNCNSDAVESHGSNTDMNTRSSLSANFLSEAQEIRSTDFTRNISESSNINGEHTNEQDMSMYMNSNTDSNPFYQVNE